MPLLASSGNHSMSSQPPGLTDNHCNQAAKVSAIAAGTFLGMAVGGTTGIPGAIAGGAIGATTSMLAIKAYNVTTSPPARILPEPETPSALETLPANLQERIFSYLDPTSLFRLATTCQALKKAVRAPLRIQEKLWPLVQTCYGDTPEKQEMWRTHLNQFFQDRQLDATLAMLRKAHAPEEMLQLAKDDVLYLGVMLRLGRKETLLPPPEQRQVNTGRSMTHCCVPLPGSKMAQLHGFKPFTQLVLWDIKKPADPVVISDTFVISVNSMVPVQADTIAVLDAGDILLGKPDEICGSRKKITRLSGRYNKLFNLSGPHIATIRTDAANDVMEIWECTDIDKPVCKGEFRTDKNSRFSAPSSTQVACIAPDKTTVTLWSFNPDNPGKPVQHTIKSEQTIGCLHAITPDHRLMFFTRHSYELIGAGSGDNKLSEALPIVFLLPDGRLMTHTDRDGETLKMQDVELGSTDAFISCCSSPEISVSPDGRILVINQNTYINEQPVGSSITFVNLYGAPVTDNEVTPEQPGSTCTIL